MGILCGCQKDAAQMKKLTTRERQVLRLLAKGYSRENVAALLGITLRTVRVHVHSIFEKVGCNTFINALRKFYYFKERPCLKD